jgi:hypothetical protein
MLQNYPFDSEEKNGHDFNHRRFHAKFFSGGETLCFQIDNHCLVSQSYGLIQDSSQVIMEFKNCGSVSACAS